MSAPRCDREAAVLTALRSDAWSDELRAHLAGCPTCSEALLVAGALLADARTAGVERPLPDPSRIWLDARRRARRLALRRATRPITVVQVVAAACAAVVTFILGASYGGSLGRWLAWLRPPSPDTVSTFAFVQGILLLAACGGFLVLAAYALITSWRHP